jgi:hypothetical protein
MSAIKIKENINACLSRMLLPEKLPRPTYRSQKERVIPISSSFPENVERRRRKTVIWSSKEEKPMKTNGIKLYLCFISNFILTYYWNFTGALMA